MKRITAAVGAIVLLAALAYPTSARNTNLPHRTATASPCTVDSAVVAAGNPITVTLVATSKDTPYGWFMVFDTGPSTRQGVSSMDVGPPYGDNGSYMIDWNRTTGVAHFRLFAQADPGVHLVTAEYRKVFAACSYTVT